MSLPIQYGLDLTVSLSVIGAAIAYFYSKISESNKAKKSAMRQHRIESMSKSIDKLSEILDEGSKMVSLVLEGQESGKSILVNGDFLDYCQKIVRYIEVYNSLSFEIWASSDEKKIIKNIHQLAVNYNNEFIEALLNKHNGSEFNVPDFLVFQKNIMGNVKILSSCLRKQVEEVII